MDMDKMSSVVSRLFFASALILLVVSVVEFLANRAGYTFLRGSWQPSRLLEYAVVLLTFVMAMLLRQIRDRQRSS